MLHRKAGVIFITLLALSSCDQSGREYAPDYPAHRRHVMEGQIKHAGPEITIYVSPSEPTKINFPRGVFSATPGSSEDLPLARGEWGLQVGAAPNLPKEGRSIHVRLIDGRQYRVLFLPADDENEHHDVMNIDMKSPSTPAGSIPMAGNDRAVLELLNHLKSAASGALKSIPDYSRESGQRDAVLFTKNELRGTVREHYRGERLQGYVLVVQNLGTVPLKLTPASIPLRGVLGAQFERSELAPRPSRMDPQGTGADQSTAFVVLGAQ